MLPPTKADQKGSIFSKFGEFADAPAVEMPLLLGDDGASPVVLLPSFPFHRMQVER